MHCDAFRNWVNSYILEASVSPSVNGDSISLIGSLQRVKEVKYLTQEHTASKYESRIYTQVYPPPVRVLLTLCPITLLLGDYTSPVGFFDTFA